MRKSNLFAITTGTAIVLAGVLITTQLGLNPNFNSFSAGGYTPSITLDSTNGYTSGSQQEIEIASGDYFVTFEYSNASSSLGNHCALAANGSIKNVDVITSVTSIQASFDGTLQARLSYDGETWGDYFTLKSGQKVGLDSPYFVEIKNSGSENTTVSSVRYEYSCTPNPNAAPSEGDQLLGVFDFFNQSTLSYTGASNLGSTPVDEDYLEAHSFDSLTSKQYKELYSQYNATYAYQDRYGGVGLAKSSGTNGILSLTLLEETRPTKVVVEASKAIDTTETVNLTLNGTALQLTKRYSTSMTSVDPQYVDTLEWEFNTPQTELEFQASNGVRRVALYRIYLYSSGSQMGTPDTPTAYEVGFESEITKTTYTSDETFDSSSIGVNALMSDGTKVAKTSSDYTFEVYAKNNPTIVIDTTKAFELNNGYEDGKYIVKVMYDDYLPQLHEISLSTIQVITNISAASATLEYHTNDTLDLSKLSATVTYNIGDNVSNAPYSQFNELGLGVKLFKDNVEHSTSAMFGTTGTWVVKIYSIEKPSVFANIEITVLAVPVTNLSLTESTATIEVEGKVQLHASINNDATNQIINWTSSDESIATVDTNGLVTGVAAGEATITASSDADNTKYGTCVVTVTEKVTGQDEGTFTLSEGSLTIGSYVVFTTQTTNSTTGYAMSKTQNTNNRPGVNVEIVSSTLERDSDSTFAAFRVEAGSKDGTYSFYDEAMEGYLAATSSTNNYLHTIGEKNANASFSITGSVEKTITAQGNYTHNTLKWNNNSKLFSCYATGQALPYIYEKAGDPVYPNSVELSGTSELYIGDVISLTAEFSPENTTMKSLTWESDDEDVATVTNGVVTAVGVGSATITATTINGIKGTFVITVSKCDVTGVELNYTSKTMNVDDKVTLVATVKPDNATNKNVTWSTSDNSVATVDEGVVTALSAGKADIIVTTSEGNFTATCKVTVNSSGSSQTTTDIINRAATSGYLASTATNSWVSNFTINGASGSTYYTHSMGTNGGSHALQWNKNGFLYSTVSGGSITEVQAVVNKTIDVYGSNSAFSSNEGGTLIGSLTSSNTSLSVNGDYEYIRIKGTDSSTVVNSITISYGAVAEVEPTSISIGNNFTLSKGQSTTLSVAYTPTGANVKKAVTWTSSNESVATVDTSGKVTANANAVKNATSTITATLTQLPSISASVTLTIVETAKANQTVLMYVCGANLESDYASSNQGLATSDLEEILSVNGQPNDVNIVVETGGANAWSSTLGINKDYLQRWHVKNKSLVKDDTLTYASMDDQSTLQSFISWGLEKYPADRTSLILWNHGGAMQGVCFDERGDDNGLRDYEVTGAVSGALNNQGMAGQKLEWIGYDACLMAVQDIAELNSDYFNYMVASQENENGEGWDYDTWVDDLYAKKATTVTLKAIVDGFIEDNDGYWDSNDNWVWETNSTSNDQTLAYFDLSQMSAYKTAFENLASELYKKINSGNKSSFNNLVKSCKHYSGSSYTSFGTFDVLDFLNKLGSNSTFNPGNTYINNAKTARTNLIGYARAGYGAGESHGICLFWAVSSKTYKGSYYTSSDTRFTEWRKIVTTYGN